MSVIRKYKGLLYRIAGNLRMVQIVALFVDGLANVKIRTAKV